MSKAARLNHTFPGQDANEPVFVLVRPNPIAFFPTAAGFTTILLLTFIAQLLISYSEIYSQDLINIVLLITGSFQLLLWIGLMVAIFDFYYDIFIVTDRRLVDINQEQIFNRRISELSMENIQDTSSEVSGIFGNIFQYGSIEIQTSGERRNFYIQNVSFYREISSLILDLSAKSRSNTKHSIPSSEIKGVINNHAFKTVQGLEDIGAISKEYTQN